MRNGAKDISNLPCPRSPSREYFRLSLPFGDRCLHISSLPKCFKSALRTIFFNTMQRSFGVHLTDLSLCENAGNIDKISAWHTPDAKLLRYSMCEHGSEVWVSHFGWNGSWIRCLPMAVWHLSFAQQNCRKSTGKMEGCGCSSPPYTLLNAPGATQWPCQVSNHSPPPMGSRGTFNVNQKCIRGGSMEGTSTRIKQQR